MTVDPVVDQRSRRLIGNSLRLKWLDPLFCDCCCCCRCRCLFRNNSLLEICKKVQLLVLLILHDLSIGVIGKHGRPSQKGGIPIRHLLNINFTLGSTIFHGRGRRAYLVGNRVVAIRHFRNAQLPDGFILVVDSDHGANTFARCFRFGHIARSNSFQFEITKLGPDSRNWSIDHGRLNLNAGRWDGGHDLRSTERHGVCVCGNAKICLFVCKFVCILLCCAVVLLLLNVLRVRR
mmetsp:Transcript_25512/g.42428  ORF Transcript_25512/g.42428 Transcript_25512/m.42428 type:complete len:234 (+) Transcript_25512:265-966(+)